MKRHTSTKIYLVQSFLPSPNSLFLCSNVLKGREDEDTYVEPYTSSEWIYIGDLEESHVWKRPDGRETDDEVGESVAKERRDSQESTESERNFRKKYQATTQRIVHRKISGEMYKRIQTKCFGELFHTILSLFHAGQLLLLGVERTTLLVLWSKAI